MLLYLSLAENVENTTWHTHADKVSTIRTWIHQNLELKNKSYRWNGYSVNIMRENFARERLISKEFGMILGLLLANGADVSDCVELCNRSRFRKVRNRTALDSVLSDHFPRNNFFSCSDCGEIMDSDGDRLHWAYHDTAVCESCIDDNYRYSDFDDTYITRDDYYDRYESDDADDDDSVIHQYHQSNPQHIPSEYDKRTPRVLMGLELECEVSDDYLREDKAHEVLDAIGYYRTDDGESGFKYCEIERDGSLNHGFEIVTGFTGLDVHRKQLEFFKNTWDGVKSHNTSTCGLHVHVCKANMTLYHAAKLIFFINDEKNHALIKALARRTSSSYAQIKNKTGNIVWLKDARKTRNPLNNLNADRYEALNFQNDKTIEFRLFRGSLKYETIQSCLEFSFLSWHFTRDASIKNLTIEKFLEFINKPENRDDSIYLREYLKNKGFETFIANKKIA